MKKPFASGSSGTPCEVADELWKSVCQGRHADLCGQPHTSGNSHKHHECPEQGLLMYMGLVSRGFNATLQSYVNPVPDAILGICFMA